MSDPIRIGIVDTEYFSSTRVASWSGLPYFMAECLKGAGGQVISLPVSTSYNTWAEKIPFALWRLRGRRYLRDRSRTYLRRLQLDLTEALRRQPIDVLFSPSSVPLAVLPPGLPAFFWTDATVNGMLDRYPSFAGLAPSSLSLALAAETRALRRAQGAFYASTWAAETARALEPQAADKIAVLRFGPNLSAVPDWEQLTPQVARRSWSTPRFLFLGVDWARKGGDFAVAVVERLRAKGCQAELHVVGCAVPETTLVGRPWIHAHGFVAKNTAEGQALLSRHLAEATWLLLPSRAECFGVVFVEAAAHGLPSLATQVDGIPSAVGDGESGRLFTLDATPDCWAEQVLAYSQNDYHRLCASARTWYETHATWAGAGRFLLRTFAQALGR